MRAKFQTRWIEIVSRFTPPSRYIKSFERNHSARRYITINFDRAEKRMIHLWRTISLLSAVLALARAWGINHAGQTGTNTKCERLSVSFCHGLRYNLTAMPNFMGHEDQLQAERGVSLLFLFTRFHIYILSFVRYRLVTDIPPIKKKKK